MRDSAVSAPENNLSALSGPGPTRVPTREAEGGAARACPSTAHRSYSCTKLYTWRSEDEMALGRCEGIIINIHVNTIHVYFE